MATVGVVSAVSPWGWGYYSYYNPYWVAPVGVTYINYSQPIVAAAPVAVPSPAVATAASPGPTLATGEESAREKALAIFESARGLFKRGDYQLALAETNRAVALVPNDSLMHEFRALCLFALQDYKQSAAAMYAVLATGPGWDEATLTSLYASPVTYKQQLRALEDYRDANAQAADARFLLAYHYMLVDKDEEAAAELAEVVELEPRDQLAAQLLDGLTATPEEKPQSGPALLPNEPVEAARLVGDWKARRGDGSKFELSLRGDNRFRWKFTQSDKDQEFSGTYTLADNYLILTASGQNTLVGHVALETDGKLQFKLAGGSPSDPGLIFTR